MRRMKEEVDLGKKDQTYILMKKAVGDAIEILDSELGEWTRLHPEPIAILASAIYNARYGKN
jgi:hypothetical protein